MKTGGLLSFLLLSMLLFCLTFEVESKGGRGGGGSRGGGSRSRGGSSWWGSSSRSRSSSSSKVKPGYGSTYGKGASSWATSSGLSVFGAKTRWGYRGGHRFYYVGYHPYGGHRYVKHHGHGDDDDLDYEWEPMNPWTVMLLVWVGLFSTGFLVWLGVYCMYKKKEYESFD